MGGSYPRTENDIIEKQKIEIAENNQRYIDGMKNSVGPIADEPRREIVPRHSNLKLPSGAIRASRNAGPEIVEVPGHGRMDVSKIDDIKITPASPSSADYRTPSQPNYEVLAKLEILNPHNHLPNFDRFKRREDIAKKSRPEQVKEYLDFRQGLAHRAEIEHQIGVKIDISTLSDPVKSRTILSDPGIVQTFSKAQEIGVSDGFLKGVALIDLKGTGGGREIERVREEFRGDSKNRRTFLAYNPRDHKVYLNADYVTPNLINNGGLVHEFFHGKRDKELGDIGLLLGIDRKHPAVPIIKSCEEAAENIRTVRFMERSMGFRDILFERYFEEPKKIPYSVSRLVWFKEPELIAEAAATFKEADPETFDLFKTFLDKEDYKEEFGRDKVDKVYGLVDNYYKAAESNQSFENSIRSSIRLMGINLPTLGRNEKPRLKKFSSFTLERRLL